MIIVSGEPRSGTSITILMLKNLGMNVIGEKYDQYTSEDFAPTGIWEDTAVSQSPISAFILEHLGYPKNAVFKLLLHGLNQSDITCLEKIIFCIRNPREVIVSQRAQRGYFADDYQWAWHNAHMSKFIERLKQETFPPILDVDFKDMVNSPEKEGKRIADFVGVAFDKQAVSHIDKQYYRSRAENIEENTEARSYYNLLTALKEGLTLEETDKERQ